MSEWKIANIYGKDDFMGYLFFLKKFINVPPMLVHCPITPLPRLNLAKIKKL